eukprot:gnl/Chilomastix_cuspidata/3483.p1 GENE.gnl/Chilomastix_cuspidata/3483~~gnl/Chilomastix_cuspidata/3483.p1  ORF type:complete len:869 (+),score=406.42 gnl/Chilomastix_cuspidata/3483:29-2635(+)
MFAREGHAVTNGYATLERIFRDIASDPSHVQQEEVVTSLLTILEDNPFSPFEYLKYIISLDKPEAFESSVWGPIFILKIVNDQFSENVTQNLKEIKSLFDKFTDLTTNVTRSVVMADSFKRNLKRKHEMALKSSTRLAVVQRRRARLTGLLEVMQLLEELQMKRTARSHHQANENVAKFVATNDEIARLIEHPLLAKLDVVAEVREELRMQGDLLRASLDERLLSIFVLFNDDRYRRFVADMEVLGRPLGPLFKKVVRTISEKIDADAAALREGVRTSGTPMREFYAAVLALVRRLGCFTVSFYSIVEFHGRAGFPELDRLVDLMVKLGAMAARTTRKLCTAMLEFSGALVFDELTYFASAVSQLGVILLLIEEADGEDVKARAFLRRTCSEKIEKCITALLREFKALAKAPGSWAACALDGKQPHTALAPSPRRPFQIPDYSGDRQLRGACVARLAAGENPLVVRPLSFEVVDTDLPSVSLEARRVDSLEFPRNRTEIFVSAFGSALVDTIGGIVKTVELLPSESSAEAAVKALTEVVQYLAVTGYDRLSVRGARDLVFNKFDMFRNFVNAMSAAADLVQAERASAASSGAPAPPISWQRKPDDAKVFIARCLEVCQVFDLAEALLGNARERLAAVFEGIFTDVSASPLGRFDMLTLHAAGFFEHTAARAPHLIIVRCVDLSRVASAIAAADWAPRDERRVPTVLDGAAKRVRKILNLAPDMAFLRTPFERRFSRAIFAEVVRGAATARAFSPVGRRRLLAAVDELAAAICAKTSVAEAPGARRCADYLRLYFRTPEDIVRVAREDARFSADELAALVDTGLHPPLKTSRRTALRQQVRDAVTQRPRRPPGSSASCDPSSLSRSGAE